MTSKLRISKNSVRCLLPLALLVACGTEAVELPSKEDHRAAGTKAEPPAELRDGILLLPSGSQEIQYEVRDGLAFMEDDILLGNADEVRSKLAPRGLSPQGLSPQGAGSGSGWRQFDVGTLWPGGRVYYTFGAGIDAATQQIIGQAMSTLSGSTPLRFEARTSQTDYVEFEDGGAGCYSGIGREGGKQVINLGPGCKGIGVITHEIAHAVGLYHEQVRNDRDTHVQILFENIQAGKEGNFQKYSRGLDLDGYDYQSIMHYDSMAFSKNGQPTILRRDGQRIPRAASLSTGDVRAIAEMYMAPPASSLAEVEGRWFRMTNSFLGGPRSLDTFGNNEPLMGRTDSYSGQYWKLTSLGGGWYRLTNMFFGEARSLDTYSNAPNRPFMGQAGNYSGQYWRLVPYGDRCFRLTNMFLGEGRSLDTYSNGNNQPFMGQTGGYSGQCWRLTVLQ